MNPHEMDPLLVGRRLVLRPILPPDIPRFYMVEHTSFPLALSRLAGRTLSIESCAESLQASVLVGMSFVPRGEEASIGYALCYDADFVSGRAKFAVMLDPAVRGEGLAAEALALFLRYLFVFFPFRCLFADVFDPNLEQFQSAEESGWLDRQGHFPEYQFWQGGYVGMTSFRVDRQGFLANCVSILEGTAHHEVTDLPSFRVVLEEETGISSSADPSKRLGDIGIDSIQIAELHLFLEEHGCLEAQMPFQDLTINDIFQLCATSLAVSNHHPEATAEAVVS